MTARGLTRAFRRIPETARGIAKRQLQWRSIAGQTHPSTLQHTYRPPEGLDFRSDTATYPTPAMLAAMASSTLGDDVLGEDADTRRLEAAVAALLGKDAGCLVASGTMGNQLAVAAHLAPFGRVPATIVADRRSHIWQWEAGGVAFLSGATVVPVLPVERDPGSAAGHLTAADVAGAVMADEEDHHVAPTRLVCLENTLDGTVHPLQLMTQIRDYAASLRLPRTASHPSPHMPVHLDGARVWNAAAALAARDLHRGAAGRRGNIASDPARGDATRRKLAVIGGLVDSASVCLSKGLGAPVGSVVVGSEEFVARVRRLRKVVGGGWRQSGPLAAAGLHALDRGLPDLHYDHFAAASLASLLVGLGAGVRLALPTETNMVWADFSEPLAAANARRGAAASAPGKAAEERAELGFEDIADYLWRKKQVKVAGGYGSDGATARFVVTFQNREGVGELADGVREWIEDHT